MSKILFDSGVTYSIVSNLCVSELDLPVKDLSLDLLVFTPVYGKVVDISGADASKSYDLIQGMCFIGQIPLEELYDSGTNHSFIVKDCVEKLSLPSTPLEFDLLVDTPTSGSVLTSKVYLRCPVQF